MTKAVSNENLAQFKAKCDETYAKVGEGGSNIVDLGEFTGSTMTDGSFKTTVTVDTALLNSLWAADAVSFTLSMSMEGVTISEKISIPITHKIEMMGIKSIEAEGIVQISGGADLEFYDHGYTICRFRQETDAGEYGLIVYPMEDNPATKMPHPYSGDTGKVPVVNSSSNGYELVSYKSTIVDRVGGAPIAVEDSPDFVEVGGTLYRKKASEVTGLTGNWTFKSNASLSAVSGKTFNVNFSSNSSTFNSIVITSSGDGNYIMYYDSTQVHSTKEIDDNVTSSTWNNAAYQNIQITNTSSLTNALEFFFWLNENATQTNGSASVSYEYAVQPNIPTPTASDNGKVLGVTNGAYALQPQSSGGITQSTVIERPEELPTATADSPDFVEVGGVLYRKKAVEGGSLLGTWVFNAVLQNVIGFTDEHISFTSNSQQFESIFYGSFGGFNVGMKYGETKVFDQNDASWINDNYKTIQITDISSLTNEAVFTSWLTANATKQGGGTSVTYSYVALADAT